MEASADMGEYVQRFSQLYLKNIGLTYFQKIISELESGGPPQFKLSDRPANSIPDRERFAGMCYVKSGYTAGSFGSWKRRFIVEGHDYNLWIYNRQESWQAREEPMEIISTAGYSVSTNVSQHHLNEFLKLRIGTRLLSGSEIQRKTTFSRYSWALVHPVRINYVFQLHEPADNSCCECCMPSNTIEPDDISPEMREELTQCVNFFKTCVTRSKPRGQDVADIAFDMTYRVLALQAGSSWNNDGTEVEMLVDLLSLSQKAAMQARLQARKEAALQNLTGNAGLQLNRSTTAASPLKQNLSFNKVRKMGRRMLEALVNKRWETTKEAGRLLIIRLMEMPARQAMEKLVEVIAPIQQNLMDLLVEDGVNRMELHDETFLKPFIQALQVSLKTGFSEARKILDQKIDTQECSSDRQQCVRYLCDIVQRTSHIRELRKAMRETDQPLTALSELSSEMFYGINVDKLCQQIEYVILQTLEAAAYTMEQRLEDGQSTPEAIKQQTLEDFDNDIPLRTTAFIKETSIRTFSDAYRKLISSFSAGTFDPSLSALNTLLQTLDINKDILPIPGAVKEFLNIQSMIVDACIEMHIGKMLENSTAVGESHNRTRASKHVDRRKKKHRKHRTRASAATAADTEHPSTPAAHAPETASAMNITETQIGITMEQRSTLEQTPIAMEAASDTFDSEQSTVVYLSQPDTNL